MSRDYKTNKKAHGNRATKSKHRVIPVVATTGLGDILERELTRMGITQDRYKEIKEKFGFPPTCGCEKRKQWLNKVGVYLGIGR